MSDLEGELRRRGPRDPSQSASPSQEQDYGEVGGEVSEGLAEMQIMQEDLLEQLQQPVSEEKFVWTLNF